VEGMTQVLRSAKLGTGRYHPKNFAIFWGPMRRYDERRKKKSPFAEASGDKKKEGKT